MIRTRTRTHVQIEFADAHLVCLTCGEPVTAWHNDDACGCDAGAWNLPCEHRAGVNSLCPSWSPVDGCTCQEVLGSINHPPTPIAEENRDA